MNSQRLLFTATTENFEELPYLRTNPDFAAAVARGEIESGAAHFKAFGTAEQRQIRLTGELTARNSGVPNYEQLPPGDRLLGNPDGHPPLASTTRRLNQK